MNKGEIELKRMRKIVEIILVITGVLLINVTAVYGSEFKFAVEPVVPKSQLNKDNTYFDIKLDPNQKEELKVALRNDTDKEVEVSMSVRSATTNSNVVIEYGANDIKKDTSLDYTLEDCVDYPKSVKIKPKSNETVTFSVKMPNKNFDGVMAGGITFKEVVKEKKQEDKKQGLSIKNEYSYVVALLMRQNENKVEPNLVLKNVTPGQINARNVILANFQNDQKTYINQVVMESKITKKGSKDILYEESKTDLQIAPNTNFSFPTPLKGASLKPGDYELEMVVYGNENKSGKYSRKNDEETTNYENQWKLKKEFSIDKKKAKELNEKDVTIEKSSFNMYWFLLLLLLLIILLAIWFIWYKKKKEKQKEQQKKERKKSRKNKSKK